ncbi:MFS general substrate transporter [Lizonia empirigonia]|nr:MFS general substrate transporter [Lizonia empirigonia]
MGTDIKDIDYTKAADDGERAEPVLVRDWSAAEEKKAKRKLDLIIMPLLTLGFFCLQLDRSNIANAITDNFMEDIGISQDQFNVGQQMLSLGIVLFEIPANMALYRVAFQTNYGSFIATRFLLGLTESGFIPDGQASAKLLAYGILHMRGVGGRAGWFWLFVLMGRFTILSGFVLGFCLPDSFKKPHPTFLPNWHMFTDREIHILHSLVHLDEPAKSRKKKRIGLVAFKKAFSNWRMWAHFAITMCNNGPQRAFDTYAPSIVQSFSFGQLGANAMAAVGLFIQIPVSIFTETNSQGAKHFGVVWTQTFGTFSHPLNITWMVIMGANIAGIYGAQIFREDDRPRYRRAFAVADGEIPAFLPSDDQPAPVVDGRPSLRTERV